MRRNRGALLRHGSLFSGIGGFDLGFERAGWECRWQVEPEPFCQAILETHWPSVQRFSDVRDAGSHNLEKVDCITAGVPCQDVSVAGKRAGLAGERTGLFYEFARILQELRPAWFVFENVPGLFSSNRGRDFAEILRVLMAECRYGVSWRVLDSRYFNVAQRRKRVFIVGRFGKPCPAEILFEPESGEGNSAQGRKAWADIAVPLTSGPGVTGNRPGRRREDDFNIVRQAISAKWSKGHSGPAGDECHNVVLANALRESDGHHGRSSPRGDGCDNIFAIQDVRGGTRDRIDSGQGIGISDSGPMYTLSKTEQHAVAFDTTQITSRENRSNPQPGDAYHPLAAGAHAPAIAYALRKDPGGIGQGHNTNFITATLNSGGNDGGFRTEPGEHLVCTAPDSDGVREFASLPKGMDSPRYRALGNAVTASVAEWIGRRMMLIAQ
jgi:DNA (cytosine-5)-methyltransferase 1